VVTEARPGTSGPEGSIVELDGETFYRIAHCDRMPPFMMSIASDTDLWMFITSTGGLTAGRTDADGSLFPYETVDRLYDAHYHTGPVTLIRTGHGEHAPIWQPFAEPAIGAFQIERHLYKNVPGNRVVFEEINYDLGLAFRYRWSGCETFGLVRSARLSRITGAVLEVEILDGVRNILPFGAPLALYQQRSSLVDAYKRSELDPATGLAIFSLTSKIIDRAEAAEELRANTVWCHGLDRPVISLSDDAVNAFRQGRPAAGETLRTGRRGHYLVTATVKLAPGAPATWHLMADAGRGPVEIVRLRERLRTGVGSADIERHLDEATRQLLVNVASADGLQQTGRQAVSMHHFANVLFNNMRGGVFADGYRAPRADLIDFLRTRHREVAARHAGLLEALPDAFDVNALLAAAASSGDPDFERLSHEYLPLCFGRRHGDPSRPWNRFSIRPPHADGSPALYYEGNWRDVFQNWEALAMSFPRYLPGMIAKFVNASTVDGFNPYRITRDGVDWEVADPRDPWGHIGYWGDHQIIYLLKLMEALHRFAPGALRQMLDKRIFSYANVPYRLKPYEAMLADPHATIDFDVALAEAIDARVRQIGTDGKLVAGKSGAIRHACLIEKLMVSVLARLSNFVADGGIWMNTQRPEWNDANNALAGNGVSVVTLFYLRRYLCFVADRLEERGTAPVTMAADVARWSQTVKGTLERHRPVAGGGARSGRERKAILDALGGAFSDYRASAYAPASEPQAEVALSDLLALCRTAIEHLDHTIALNRRSDGLYHAYHVLGPTDGDTLTFEPLYEMLEGQVAAMSAGAMVPAEAARLIETLFESRMYDPVRRSFMLYPDRELPGFLEKNVVPVERARSIELLRRMLAAGDSSIVALDATGTCRFHPDFDQARLLAARLDTLAASGAWGNLVARDRQGVLGLYEDVFHHRAFTGRSGTMYGYEGLGCIYWHMVAKLLLAVQEQVLRAIDEGDPARGSLVRGYERIRAGLGFEKSPAEYGAFPTDPYSHTPRHAGAQQPGMTGQVKEEILTRFGELGVRVDAGVVRFRPVMLRRSEFRSEPGTFRFFDVAGRPIDVEVPGGALAFTFCQVPILYHLGGDESWVRVTRRDGVIAARTGDALDSDVSQTLFDRGGDVARIDVGIPEHALLAR
jgi:hypothetical protein